jgi:hypothetical protein
MPAYDYYQVSRTLQGGFPGYDMQNVVQSRIVAVPTGSPAPAGGTLAPGADTETHYTFDSNQTTLPTIATDYYGSFPGV